MQSGQWGKGHNQAGTEPELVLICLFPQTWLIFSHIVAPFKVSCNTLQRITALGTPSNLFVLPSCATSICSSAHCVCITGVHCIKETVEQEGEKGESKRNKESMRVNGAVRKRMCDGENDWGGRDEEENGQKGIEK